MTNLSIEEGYATLAQNERDWIAAGRVPSGWKVGLTSVEAQRRIGSEGPCFGRLFSDMASPNESTIEWGRFGNPRIEAEIAFRLGKDLNPGGATSDAIEATIPATASSKGNATSRIAAESLVAVATPRNIVPMIEPAYDSKRSAPMPATSPTLSPTLSAIVAGFR